MKKLACFLVLIFVTFPLVANTAEIEDLRTRTKNSNAELSSEDKEVIASFWSDMLDRLLLTESSEEQVDLRRQLAEQKGDEYLSFYADAYVQAAKSAIETAVSDARRMENGKRGRLIERNLMILTADLKSPALAASLALPQLGSEDEVIRYWAMKAVTNSGVVQQLTSEVTGDEKITEAILTAVNQRMAAEANPKILTPAIRFCMSLDHPLAREALIALADRRIKAYRDWTVQDVPLETTLLTALGNVTMLDPGRKQFPQKFAELYAVVIQRYIQGKGTFDKAHVEELLTVIAEVDQNTLSKTMSVKTGIFQALKRKSGLEREYETLFGDRLRAGQLATQFKFDYGKDASGKPLTSPPALQPKSEKAEDQG